MIPQETMNSDEIYEDLCNKIEKLVYLPGDKISENELCRQYGVSRHIIRTVISRLKERMLLTVYPQRGTFVSLIDMKSVELILFIRESVEQEAIRLLQFEKQEVRDRMSEAMKACIERQRTAISENIDRMRSISWTMNFTAVFWKPLERKDVMGITGRIIPFPALEKLRCSQERKAERNHRGAHCADACSGKE